MIAKKPLTENVRQKIAIAIKNGLDISDIIANYQIKNEYLAGAIIKNINRVSEDLQNINFVRCVIGEEGKVTNLSGCDLKGCNFSDTRFLGTIWFKGCDLRNCNFTNAFMPNVEYQRADLRNIMLCDAVFRFGSKEGYKCKFSKKTFEQLFKFWEIE
jgi:uncharacterized protein YjbI with pentapeptide repeats